MKKENTILKLFILNLIIFISVLANDIDMNNVKGYTGDSSKLLGIIENQSWVTSKVLSEDQLKKVIKKYDNFKIIRYDSLYGVLVEYEHLNSFVLEELEKLKQEPGIYKIFNRVYEGRNAFEVNTGF